MKKIFLGLFVLSFFILPYCVFAESVNINTATLEQLDLLTGIGPAYAQRIIDGRPFNSVDELDRIKGIGPATLQKIKDQGFACVNCETSIFSDKDETKADNATTTPDAQKIYPTGIIINEVMPNPEGADETEEWIEIFNQNNNEVDLAGWIIEDTNGSIKTYTLPDGTKIMANGFLVLSRLETKIMLNNDSDGLNLLNPNKTIVDSVAFVSAPLGQSYNKFSSGWVWSLSPTKGAINIASVSNKTLPKSKNSAKNDISDAKLASVNEAINFDQEDIKQKNPWFLFLIVLGITTILGVVVLIIKFKLKTNVRT